MAQIQREGGKGVGLAVRAERVDPRVDQRASERYRLGTSPRPDGSVRAHLNNPVAWQLWGTETIELARRENKLLFVSIGYNACHWCHVMEHESFENQEVASILNSQFIPVKIDREERPDIDRIYMNFVQATTGSGGWPLNVFVTPELVPVFAGTYWPGPNRATSQLALEDQLDFLGILRKLDTVWQDQEDRCRQESRQILQQLKEFASEGIFGSAATFRLGDGDDGLDIDVLEDAYQNFVDTFDPINGGFGDAPKFPTPSKLNFLLRLKRFPQPVLDIVGEKECDEAERMAMVTLRKMARGGIRDHIGHGFSRYSVTRDWSLPHFEKMLSDNAQLLHLYLDAWLISHDPEMLNVVYDIATYLTSPPICRPSGGFHSSEDADSLHRPADTEKREGAFYVWTRRELHAVLGPREADVVSAFYGASDHGNVSPAHDANDEFMNQNVLAIVSTPGQLAAQFGMREKEVVDLVKEAKRKLRAHRERERVPPSVDDKIVAGWNGLAIGALARTAAALRPSDAPSSMKFLAGATKAAAFLRENLYDERTKTLIRVWRDGPGDVSGFADDYAFLINGLIDLYESTFHDEYLRWADDLQQTQIKLFYDFPPGQSLRSLRSHSPSPSSQPPGIHPTTNNGSSTTAPDASQDSYSDPGTGGFFATPPHAPLTILRLKDGMDTAEPSSNGASISNLYRLGAALADEAYAALAGRSLTAFEGEMLQYPWLYASFLPGLVAREGGVRAVVLIDGEGASEEEEGPIAVRARGALSVVVRVVGGGGWIRERNALLRDLGIGRGGRVQGGRSSVVMVCKGGKCRLE